MQVRQGSVHILIQLLFILPCLVSYLLVCHVVDPDFLEEYNTKLKDWNVEQNMRATKYTIFWSHVLCSMSESSTEST